jgi:glycosyltransferase involved in cell wall biosynthesis
MLMMCPSSTLLSPQSPPDFSIIVPAHNAASTLGETLDSVVTQTLHSWEAIVVDDGSTDRTAAIAEDYAARDPRFTVVRRSNRGRSLARNAGVALSSGEFLCPLDADDVYLPSFLEAQHQFIVEHPGFDVYSCNVDAWMPDGSRLPYALGSAYLGIVETRLDDLLERNRFTILTVFRRDMFERLGGFRPSLERLEDYDLWVRAAAAGSRLLHNPATLALYRQRLGGAPDEYPRMLLAQRDVLVDLLHHGDLKPQTRARARSTIEELGAVAARNLLEQQIDSRRFRGARRLLWAARATYPVKAKLVLGLGAVMVSPRLFGWMVAARRRALPPGCTRP